MDNNFLDNQEEQDKNSIAGSDSLIMKKKEAIAKYDNEVKNEVLEKKSAFESFKNKFSHHPESEENQEILNTNLIKNEITSFIDWKEKSIVLVLYTLLLIMFLLGSYAYTFYLEKKEIAKNAGLDEEIAVIKFNIEESEAKVSKGVALQKKISLAQSILARHVYWSPFFDFLEESTAKNVYYKSFSCDTSGSYSFPAAAQGGYYTVSEQLKSLRENDLVKSADLAEADAGKGGGEEMGFSIKIELDRKIFQK